MQLLTQDQRARLIGIGVNREREAPFKTQVALDGQAERQMNARNLG